RRKPAHVVEQRLVARWSVIREEIGKRIEIQRRGGRSAGKQRLDLGGEEERAVVTVDVVERLHTEAIPREQQLAALLVPDREREHAAQRLLGVHAIALVQPQHGFGVAPCPVSYPM